MHRGWQNHLRFKWSSKYIQTLGTKQGSTTQQCPSSVIVLLQEFITSHIHLSFTDQNKWWRSKVRITPLIQRWNFEINCNRYVERKCGDRCQYLWDTLKPSLLNLFHPYIQMFITCLVLVTLYPPLGEGHALIYFHCTPYYSSWQFSYKKYNGNRSVTFSQWRV